MNTVLTNWKALAVVLILAAFLRFWGAFDITDYTDDEYVQVPSAVSLFKYGTTTELQWVHPPLSSHILYGTITLFGDNPYGWRMGNIVFGTATVILIYLVGMHLYPGTAVPLLAASLLALDPFHIDISRTTFMEIPTSFFFFLYLYFMLKYCEHSGKALFFAGIALGLTIATKAYYIFTVPMVAAYAFYRARQRGESSGSLLIDFSFLLFLLPLTIYFLSFIHWFGRGYTLTEFVQMKNDAVWTVKNLTLSYFHASDNILAAGKPWQWFLKPVIYGYQTFSDGNSGRFLLEINNFPFRMLTIPSLVMASVYAWRKKLMQELLVPFLFVVCYFIFLIVNRPIFSTNATVLLPFAYLIVARTVVLIARQRKREYLIYAGFLSCVLAWGLYTFPLVSGQLVPLSLYQPIISMTHFMQGH
ncbi:MAG: glycosyltransferase family 39 protein [Nitrospirae bacterium]|nr:glycosyltransferase family 39 protein [Nitrospirota bacterium]